MPSVTKGVNVNPEIELTETIEEVPVKILTFPVKPDKLEVPELMVTPVPKTKEGIKTVPETELTEAITEIVIVGEKATPVTVLLETKTELAKDPS